MTRAVTVIGGGLAGSEAALQLADRGIPVDLWEMRPTVPTPAHRTDRLAEIVCSNSFKSTLRTKATGLLKQEMLALGSRLLRFAEEHRVEAGSALAVDRERFQDAVTDAVERHPGIRLHREELPAVPAAGTVIVATGPLTSDSLVRSLTDLLGIESLYFYDATAPIVAAESIDRDIVFEANRRDADSPGDYLNCPMSREEYDTFVDAVLAADRYPLHEFETGKFFESCMPIDELAARGRQTLAFGPMRPVGLVDPRTGGRPHAVVQLRPENRERTSYNLVGFQNRMRHGEQRRVLRLIPGLAKAEFYRLGRIHRNTYLEAPRVLDERLRVRRDPRVYLAGQLTGLEGYVECVATGLYAGLHAAAEVRGETLPPFPPETAMGAMIRFCTAYEGKDYRPSNVNFGLFPPLADGRVKGRDRAARMADRAEAAFQSWLAGSGRPEYASRRKPAEEPWTEADSAARDGS